MNRRELLREMSRVQATWVNRNTPGTGDVDISAEDEQEYLTRISAVFEQAREEMRRKRGRSARALAATLAIEALLAGFDKNQPRDRKGRWTDRADAPSAPAAKPATKRTPAKKAAPRGGDGGAPAKKAAAGSGASDWLKDVGTGKVSPQTEKGIRNAFAFKDPDTGMSAEVASVDATAKGIEITVNVLDPEGRIVGKAVRTLQPPEGGGKPQMYHTSLFLGKRAQGGGFSSRWLRQTEDRYRDAGIGSIGLTTNDVGSYAWAKAGFDFADQDQVKQIADRFSGAAKGAPAGIAVDVKKLAQRAQSKNRADWPVPAEFAMLGWTPGATSWFGKDQMLGTAWKGVKEL